MAFTFGRYTSHGKSEICCYQKLFSLRIKSFQQKGFARLKYFAFRLFLEVSSESDCHTTGATLVSHL